MLSLSKAEKSYIQAGLLATPPSRADARALLDYREVALETGISPLANGSARLSIGRTIRGGGDTEVIAATKLEVESVGDYSEGQDGGRIVCSVSCSSSAYPHHSSGALEDLQADLTSLLHTTFSHPSLHPSNLSILSKKKSWLLHLDVLVLSDSGNILDALFMASRAALWDTRVPRTRAVEFKAHARKKARVEGGQGDMDVDEHPESVFDTRPMPQTMDFELPDYWDEGEILDHRDRWPVAVTLNIEPPIHFLDATLQEEAACPLKLLLAFSFSRDSTSALQAMRILGHGELQPQRLEQLIKEGEVYAHDMFISLNAKLKDEEIRRTQKANERFELHR